MDELRIFCENDRKYHRVSLGTPLSVLSEQICSTVYDDKNATELPVLAALVDHQLKELAADGLVERIDYHETPPRVEYRLTPDGEDLMPIFDAMQAYIRRRMAPGHEFSTTGHSIGES